MKQKIAQNRKFLCFPFCYYFQKQKRATEQRIREEEEEEGVEDLDEEEYREGK